MLSLLVFMINSSDFRKMRTEFDRLDNQRESIILLSREIIRISKQLIYSVHRNDTQEMDTLSVKIRAAVKKLQKLNAERIFEPSARIACQEYVEAMCFYGVVKNKKLPTSTDLGVTAEHYLLGLTDLGGELVRRAINEAIKGNHDDAVWIKDIFTEIYGQFLQFDFRNGDLRKKFDGMKYDLKKLEDLAFQIKLKK